MKSVRTLLLLALAGGLPAYAALEQNSPPTRSTDEPALVWDLAPDLVSTGFRNFRTTDDRLKARAGAALPDLTGLSALRESGSSEFSAAGLKSILSKLSGPVTVFDLRQEDHGFINGDAVSWYATNNWANVGKGLEEIVREEKGRLESLAPGASVTLSADSAKKGLDAAGVQTKTEKVSSCTTEEQVVRAAGAAYVRIPVSDHARPTDEEVDRFVASVRELPAGGWVHFHCRAGKGRTTTFMALYDMLRNAQRVSLQSIVGRQSLLIGDYDLLSKTADAGPRAGVAADRAAFVRAFYEYAKANPGGRPQIWTEWLKTQP
jgi:protein tyrosine phosphatase (PTP) superfamily phosphohydrolase (DUF442 family)